MGSAIRLLGNRFPVKVAAFYVAIADRPGSIAVIALVVQFHELQRLVNFTQERLEFLISGTYTVSWREWS